MGHSGALVAAFSGSGEPRLVFARLVDGSPVYMAEGQAKTFKQRREAGESFQCIVPTCDRPTLNVHDRSRSGKRDGFAHHGGGGHGIGVSHLQAQLLLAAWLREKYPGLRVELEETTEDGQRRADVMATSTTTGQRIAFEVQYSAMTSDEWTQRHESYRALGIMDVWLWGHSGPQFQRAHWGQDHVLLTPAQREAAKAGLPVLWINPESRQVAHAWVEVTLGNDSSARILATDWSGQLDVDSVDGFCLTRDREFVSSKIAELLLNTRRQSELRERMRAEQEDRRQAELAAREDRLAQMTEKRDRRAAAFARSPAAALIRETFGAWPSWLDHSPMSSTGSLSLPLPSTLWQAHLYLSHLHDKPHGHRINVLAMRRQLESMDPEVSFADQAIRSWLGALRAAGIVHVERMRGSNSYRTGSKPERPNDTRTLVPLSELAAAGVAVPPPRPSKKGHLACAACGRSLIAQSTIRLGYHPDCADDLARLLGHSVTREASSVTPSSPVANERRMRPVDPRVVWMDADGRMHVDSGMHRLRP